MEGHLPLVSVIIPIFNGRKFIRECLQSVLGQEYPHLEIIAIEDGSERDSEDIVRRFPAVTYVRQRNKGNAVARNNGIAMSRGAYIAFLDCDDMYDRSKTTTQIRYFADHPACRAVSGLTREFVQPGIEVPQWVRSKALQGDHAGSSPGTLMVAREVFDEVGLFDPEFTMTSDIQWLMRARRSGVAVPHVSRVVLHKRIHSQNQSAFPSPNHVASYHRELVRIFATR